MTQLELENEPIDTYRVNLEIMALENKLRDEAERREERSRESTIRQGG
jgi:hypothetical protein